MVASGKGVRISRRSFALLAPFSESVRRCRPGVAGLCRRPAGFSRATAFCGSAFRRCWPSSRKRAFYSIQNDVLSPLAFGAAFILPGAIVARGNSGCPARNAHRSGARGDVPDQNQQPAPAGRVRLGGAVQNWMSGQVGKIARRRTGAGGTGVVRGPADDCLAGVVQAHLRRFHRHGGENSISRLDAQTVQRMVASSDFHAARFVDLYVGTPGDVLAGRISLASPAAGVAGRGRDLRNFIRRFRRGGGGSRCFHVPGDRVATAGALVRLLDVSSRRWRFWGSCPSFTIFTTAFIRRAPIPISRRAG